MRLAAALTRHELPGASHNSRAERIHKPLAADIAQALAAIGVRKRKGKLHAGASCPCGGRLRFIALVTEREAVAALLESHHADLSLLP